VTARSTPDPVGALGISGIHRVGGSSPGGLQLGGVISGGNLQGVISGIRLLFWLCHVCCIREVNAAYLGCWSPWTLFGGLHTNVVSPMNL